MYQAPQQQISISDAVINQAKAIHNNGPSAASEEAMRILSYNQYQNPTVHDLRQKVHAAFQSLQTATHLHQEFIAIAGELMLVTAALKSPNLVNVVPQQIIYNLQGAKQKLQNDLQALNSKIQQPAYSGGYGMQQEPSYDPYATANHVPQPQQHMPAMNTAYDYVEQAVQQTQTYGNDDYDDPLFNPQPQPSIETQYDSRVIDNGFDTEDDWDKLDALEDLTGEVPTEVISSFQETTYPPVEMKEDDEEEPDVDDGVPYTTADCINDIELFEIDEKWLDTISDAYRQDDGSVLGAVIIGGRLLLPEDAPNQSGHAKRVNTMLRHYKAFASAPRKSEEAKHAETVYVALENLPVDYNTLSPKPIICQDPSVNVIAEDDLPEEEAELIVNTQVIRQKDTTRTTTSLRAMAAALVFSRKANKVTDPLEVPVAVFVGYDFHPLTICEGFDKAKEAFTALKPSDSFDVLYTAIEPSLRPNFLTRLDALLEELINVRLDLPTATWGDLDSTYHKLRDGVLDIFKGSKDVEAEFDRAVNAAFFGEGHLRERLSDHVDIKRELTAGQVADQGVFASLADEAQPTVSVNVKVPQVILSTWMTSDDLGLSEDGLLSEVTHHSIAATVMDIFTEFPSLTSITVVDGQGTHTKIYRGVGNARHQIVI